MTTPVGMPEFFTLEATEYLDRLDAIVQSDEPPADDFVRLARALRGAALMASLNAIAKAAQGLESLARAVREGHRRWDPALRALSIRAVDDLRIYVRKASQWSGEDSTHAEALSAELSEAAGRPSAQVRAVEARGLDAGARAFVARESAAIASALDRASSAVRLNPGSRDAIEHVLEIMQPLRGLSALADLPPLPDLLEGIERASAELAEPGHRRFDAGALFAAAARAVSRAGGEVAEQGRPEADAPEAVDFIRQLGILMSQPGEDAPIVSIETLFFDDGGPHILAQGEVPAQPSVLDTVQLVSHGEHLRQAADDLERAVSSTQRELRAHALRSTFRNLSASAGGALADAVSAFATAAGHAAARGAVVGNPLDFAGQLRTAGGILSRAADANHAELGVELRGVAQALELMEGEVAAAEPEPGAPATAIPPEPPAAEVEPTPVAAPPPPAPPRDAVAPVPPAPSMDVASGDAGSTGGLAGSWEMYHRMCAEHGRASVGALDEFLRGGSQILVPAGDTTPTPAPEAAAESLVAPPPRPEAEPVDAPRIEVVSIDELLYSRSGALSRVLELREAVNRASGAERDTLLQEVFDLVDLAQSSPG